MGGWEGWMKGGTDVWMEGWMDGGECLPINI